MATCRLRGCNRPVHRDPKSGITHDYCGRTHAMEALGGALADPHGVCHTCQLPGCEEPVYYDRAVGRVHDFCCSTHAYEAVSQGFAPPSNRQRQGESTPHNRCSLPGCSAPRPRATRARRNGSILNAQSTKRRSLFILASCGFP